MVELCGWGFGSCPCFGLCGCMCGKGMCQMWVGETLPVAVRWGFVDESFGLLSPVPKFFYFFSPVPSCLWNVHLSTCRNFVSRSSFFFPFLFPFFNSLLSTCRNLYGWIVCRYFFVLENLSGDTEGHCC